MRVEVKVPQLPESVAEATLVSWHKQPGDAVERDENLIDVETDKVVLELPAPDAGVLVEIVTAERCDGRQRRGDRRHRHRRRGRRAPRRRPPQPAPAAAPAAAGAAAVAARRRPALPAARKMMAEQGVDPAAVEGTGRGGRITKGDVLAAVDGAGRRRPAAAARVRAACARRRHARAALGDAPGAARADVAACASASPSACVAVAVDRRDPDHVQRGQHAAGDRPAQPVQGPLREGARREARLHVASSSRRPCTR